MANLYGDNKVVWPSRTEMGDHLQVRCQANSAYYP